MTHEVRLADIGEGLEEAEIINWLVKVGDRVERDQPLIEVMTDKSNAELPAPVSGTVVDLAGQVGDIIHVGELIAVIADDAASGAPVTPPDPQAPATTDTSPGSPPPSRPSQTTPAVVRPPEGSSPTTAAVGVRPKAAPSTRRAAAERGIDLATVRGTGPGGRILLSDLDIADIADRAGAVERPASSRAAEPTSVAPNIARTPPQRSSPPPRPPQAGAPGGPADPVAVAAARATTSSAQPASTSTITTPGTTTEPLRGIRRAVAQNVAKSWAEIPHIHSFAHIDAEPMLDMRSRLRETQKQAFAGITPLAFFVAAVARALRSHPAANASIDIEDDEIVYHGSVNVGVAVAAPQGLVVPVLHQADQMPFEELSSALVILVAGAREGSLAPNQYRKGTVTVTNFGSLGGEQAVPIIRSPESMIFGFGSIAERPFVIEGELLARRTMHLVAGADHRLLDGDITTAVLGDIGESLVDPLRLVL